MPIWQRPVQKDSAVVGGNRYALLIGSSMVKTQPLPGKVRRISPRSAFTAARLILRPSPRPVVSDLLGCERAQG